MNVSLNVLFFFLFCYLFLFNLRRRRDADVTLTSRKSRVAVKCRVRRHASFTCGSEVIYCYTYLTRYPQYSTAQWSECIARSDRLFNMTLQHALASMNVTLASAL